MPQPPMAFNVTSLNQQNRIAALRDDLRRRGGDIAKLAEELKMLPPKSLDNLKTFITEDAAMIQLKEAVVELCESDDPVLIHGETGTGKEIIASSLHGRRTGAFLAVNTTSLPDTLLESELFGHIKGSFTGAIEDRVGKFEAATNGTIFLDEIGDMKSNMQEKLLRALQEKTITRVGCNMPRPINCRVIAATHKIIRREIPAAENGIPINDATHRVVNHGKHSVIWLKEFREDLYWRLATHELHITPLRERPADIREILDRCLDKQFLLPEEFRDTLTQLPLTGNVRELQARVARELLRIRMEQVKKQNQKQKELPLESSKPQ